MVVSGSKNNSGQQEGTDKKESRRQRPQDKAEEEMEEEAVGGKVATEDGGDVGVEGVDDEDGGAVEVVGTGGAKTLSLKLLPLVRQLQAKHGLRHGDYQRYRGYCSRRLSRLRKALKMTQGDRRKFVKKDVTVESLKAAATAAGAAATSGTVAGSAAGAAVSEEMGSGLESEGKLLQLPLMAAERAWAYAMQLKFETNTEPRKKYHMASRLRKARAHAEHLEKLAMDPAAPVDARTKLEAQAYSLWMSGVLHFELGEWRGAMAALGSAKDIYERLADTALLDTDSYRARMDEIVPSLRYCAYNVGDASARQDLMNLRVHLRDNEQLDELIRETREQQARTLQEVEWRGRKMPVNQEKARTFLLREQEFQTSELATSNSTDETISAYESLLMDCKDAIQALKDDLIEDPAFRNRQQAKEGPVSPGHFLHTYLCFIKCNKTIERNLVIVASMKHALENPDQKQADSKGKKTVKPNDLARLYENIIQNLNDTVRLAGLEEDLELHHQTEAKITFYKANRCYFLALSLMGCRRWAEAMALFERAASYAKKAKADKQLDGNLSLKVAGLLDEIEGRQFMAHANAIMEREETVAAGDEKDSGVDTHRPLIERLDAYYEDPDLSKGKPNLVRFPPPFEPIPCKPLFFDLAREHIAFPDLEEKMMGPGQSKAKGQAGSGGWLGGWLGWGSKK